MGTEYENVVKNLNKAMADERTRLQAPLKGINSDIYVTNQAKISLQITAEEE